MLDMAPFVKKEISINDITKKYKGGDSDQANKRGMDVRVSDVERSTWW